MSNALSSTLSTFSPAIQSKVRRTLKVLSPESREALRIELRRRLAAGESRGRLYSLFPGDGPLRRELYPRHMRFFAAGGRHEPGEGCPEGCDGSPHNERAFVAANRVGKTTAAGYEAALHLTGWYPDWWAGARFDRPVDAWGCGVDAKAMREAIQPVLFGPDHAPGTGMIPGDLLLRSVARGGTPGSIDFAQIRHATGGTSIITLKTYDQGRDSFQGAKKDVVWLDEEPPSTIYGEVLTRTMATVPGEANGLLLATFTPLKGWSEVVKSFLPSGAAAR